MSKRKIVVPEEMLRAAVAVVSGGIYAPVLKSVIEAALDWLTDDKNIVSLLPPDTLTKIAKRVPGRMLTQTTALLAVHVGLEEMFLSPEPEFPEEIKDLLLYGADFIHGQNAADEANKNILKAFRIGKEAGPK
jgi:hypothetical protein